MEVYKRILVLNIHQGIKALTMTFSLFQPLYAAVYAVLFHSVVFRCIGNDSVEFVKTHLCAAPYLVFFLRTSKYLRQSLIVHTFTVCLSRHRQRQTQHNADKQQSFYIHALANCLV